MGVELFVDDDVEEESEALVAIRTPNFRFSDRFIFMGSFDDDICLEEEFNDDFDGLEVSIQSSRFMTSSHARTLLLQMSACQYCQ